MLFDYIHQSSTFICRHALDKVGILDESYHMCMDYEYWVHLALADLKMIYVPEIFSSARLTKGTKTKSQTIKFLADTIKILDSVYNLNSINKDVRCVKNAAYANAWRLGGIRYFDVRQDDLARQSMINSLKWQFSPGWKLWLISALIILQSIMRIHLWSPNTHEKIVK